MPSWDEDSPQLRQNLSKVLDEVVLAAQRREYPTVAAAKRWQSLLMKNLAVQENVLEMLQRVFSLFGAREGCCQGQCGCCTVMVNGNEVSGCLYLAALVDGADVLTIEGLSQGGRLDRIQQAFIENAGLQCGFCTPGMILTAKELLDTDSHPGDEHIRRHLSGNLCRCGAYPDIVKAVKAASTGE